MAREVLDPVAQDLADKLRPFPYTRFTTDGRELRMRCPYCGDSVKHANSTHLYIKIYRESTNEPFPFYCQRCQIKGLVNDDFFKRLNINDVDLKLKLIKINHLASKTIKKYKKVEKRNLVIPNNYIDDRQNRTKLNYINTRLGINLSYKDLKDYKIVLNLYDLLDTNNVQNLTCPVEKADVYDKNFVGFVSYDNNYLIQRNLSRQVLPDVRYNNYNIFNNHDNAKKFYVIPTTVDTMSDKFKLVLAEGSFDILGVFHNVYDGKCPPNTIFASINGVGYLQVVTQMLKITTILDYELEIYSDNDQTLEMFKSLKRDLKELAPKRIKVFYNTIEKDYGVPKDKINLISHMI